MTAASHGIQSGLTYRVRYRAINEIGEGPWSDVAFIKAMRLPLTPPSPTVQNFNDSVITLGLEHTADDGDAISLSYKLYSNEGTEGSVFHQITAYDGSSLTYDVKAGDAVGSSG